MQIHTKLVMKYFHTLKYVIIVYTQPHPQHGSHDSSRKSDMKPNYVFYDFSLLLDISFTPFAHGSNILFGSE